MFIPLRCGSILLPVADILLGSYALVLMTKLGLLDSP